MMPGPPKRPPCAPVSHDGVKYQLAQGGAPSTKPESKDARNTKSALGTLVLLSMAGMTAAGLGWFFYWLDSPRELQLLSGFWVHISTTRFFELRLPNSSMALASGILGKKFKDSPDVIRYEFVVRNETHIQVAFNNQANFFAHWSHRGGISIYDMEWLAGSCHHSILQDCFHLGHENWYGEGTQRPQRWTLGPRAHGEEAFTLPDAFHGVRERLWLSSSGLAIHVPWTVPLWVSFNHTADGLLCIGSKTNPKVYPFRNWNDTKFMRLRYRAYVGPDILTTSRYLLHYVLPRQKRVPIPSLLQHPAWTYPVTNHSSTAETETMDVGRYANEISRHDFTGRYLFLPDMFINTRALNNGQVPEVFHGVNDADICVVAPVKPAALITDIGDLGIRLKEPYSFQPELRANSGRVFRKVMTLLSQFGTCSTSIALDISYDNNADIYHSVLSKHKLSLLHVLASSSLSIFQNTPIFLRTAADMQSLPAIIKMRPITGWRGLQALIPEALLISLMGYPFIMASELFVPDGRLSYSYDSLSSNELYVRWIQTVALFPSIHFGTPPWSLGANTTLVVQDFLRLRRKYLPNIIEGAEETILSGAPIIRPLWWLSPHDPHALGCQDQFVLGDDVIVAPVLRRAARFRDVYLPHGYWYDHLRHDSVIGPCWLLDYVVELSELAVFTKEMLPSGPPEMDSLMDLYAG